MSYPLPFCNEHWALWWAGFDPEMPFESGDAPDEQMLADARDMVARGISGVSNSRTETE